MKQTAFLSVALLACSIAVCRAQPCPATVMLTAPVSGTGTVEQAGSHLIGNNLVQSGDIAYRAGQSVTLTAGFEAKPGAVFEASIAACQPDARSSGPESTLTLGAYPNPFDHNTLIEYTLPEASPVRVVISDLKGVALSTLLSEKSQAAGTHRITFASESLAAGVYLCTLDTPLGRKTLRIVKQR